MVFCVCRAVSAAGFAANIGFVV
eukprot:SAG25_NODE_12490_length_279_cov_0.850000_1_plen_22_part_01